MVPSAQDGLELRNAQRRIRDVLEIRCSWHLTPAQWFWRPVQANEQIPGLGLTSPPEMAARPFAAEPYKPEAGGTVRAMRTALPKLISEKNLGRSMNARTLSRTGPCWPRLGRQFIDARQRNPGAKDWGQRVMSMSLPSTVVSLPTALIAAVPRRASVAPLGAGLYVRDEQCRGLLSAVFSDEVGSVAVGNECITEFRAIRTTEGSAAYMTYRACAGSVPPALAFK
jgi:hypothetical protein